MDGAAMKIVHLYLPFAFFSFCTSGSELDVRNNEIFNEAAQLAYPAFTTTQATFDGNIQALVAAINGRTDNSEATCAATTGCAAVATIEGIVSIPSNYGFDLSTNATGCDTPPTATEVPGIYGRSFVLQDGNAGVLVLYGKEPPSQDSTAHSSRSMYILNARNPSMAVFGDRVRITVNRVQKYGTNPTLTTNSIPVVTDFDVTTVTVLSSRNSVPFTVQSSAAAFSRGTDLYKVRRLEGYVTTQPTFVECSTGARSFQYNFQTGYRGVICVGASSFADAEAGCSTGAKRQFSFNMSLYLGAGTLSGFDTGDMFSYNINRGAKVRLTGPVIPSLKDADDTNLAVMLGQRLQVETLK
jgi:hypothetical protein